MARSFKDDSAFNNWERDIKQINRNKTKTDDKLPLSHYKRQIEEELANLIGTDISSNHVTGYMNRGKAVIEQHYTKETPSKNVAKEVLRDFEPIVLGFSHNKADQWTKNGIQTAPVIEEPKKKRRSSKDSE